MIATPRTIGVEVLLRDLVAVQIGASRAVFLDRTSRRNVVRGHTVTKDRQRLCISDVSHWGRRHFHAFEERWASDVCAGRVPLVCVRGFDFDRLPVLIAIIDIGVAIHEHRTVDIGRAVFRNLCIAWPDVCKHHIITILILANRRSRDIFSDRAFKRIGDDQRRGCKEVRANVRADAAFEVAVA